MATAPSLSARAQLINACKARRFQASPGPAAARAPAASARLKFPAIWGKEGGRRRKGGKKQKTKNGGGEDEAKSREREKKGISLL
jgi:hypothetical protein